MQTVKFQCGKCQKVMAVGADLLGKQVRCPHCQQIILAPATAPAPALAPAGAPAGGGAPEVVFRMPAARTEEEGSIFGESEEEGDDLFNSPKTPTVELPPSPAAPPPNPAAQMSTVPMPGLAAQPASGNQPAEGNGEGAAEMDSPAARARQLARSQSQKENKLTLMLLIVIVPYALMMTLFAIFLVLSRPKSNDFPKLLPDAPTENKQIHKRADDSRPLADEVKVAIGSETPLKVNQIEVTPLKVAWKKVAIAYENRNFDPEPSAQNALVLTLRVKNVSDKDSFAPNDLFFNRFYDPSNSANKPYTCVEVLDKGMEERFYGGPTKWRAKQTRGGLWREKDAREYVKGAEHSRILQPGESMEMIVCTNPDNANIFPTISAAGSLLWRIQLRCGFVAEEDRYGTITTVIGVPFKTSDIVNES